MSAEHTIIKRQHRFRHKKVGEQARRLLDDALQDVTNEATKPVNSLGPDELFSFVGKSATAFLSEEKHYSEPRINIDTYRMRQKLAKGAYLTQGQRAVIEYVQAPFIQEVIDAPLEAYIAGYRLFTYLYTHRSSSPFSVWPVDPDAMSRPFTAVHNPVEIFQQAEAHAIDMQPFAKELMSGVVGKIVAGFGSHVAFDVFEHVNFVHMASAGIGMASIQLENGIYETIAGDLDNLRQLQTIHEETNKPATPHS